MVRGSRLIWLCYTASKTRFKLSINMALKASVLKKIEADLKAELESLEEQLKTIARSSQREADGLEPSFPSYGDQADENASEVADYSARWPVEKEAERNLSEVKAALERLSQGRYGLCERCGQPIGEERLLAMPTARRCLDHQ